MNPTWHKYLNWILVLLPLFFFSCRTIERPASKIDQAREYMNQRDYAKAEVLLREILAESPDTPGVRVMLASAVAGSTGFDFLKPVASLRTIMDQQSTSLLDSPEAPPPAPNPNDKAATSQYVEKSLRTMTRESLEFFQIVGYFPYQEKGVKRERVKEAIILLDQVDPSERDYSSAIGFAFILNSMQFLNLLRDSFGQYTIKDGLKERVKRDGELLCTVKHADLMENIILMSFYMSNAVKNINDLQISRNQVATSLQRLLKSTQTIENVVNASRSDLRFIGDTIDAIAKSNCEP